MPNGPTTNHAFKEFIQDQLRDLDGLAFRAMFGGFGLYRYGRFFACLRQGELFFKTDNSTRAKYIALGMDSFRPSEKHHLKAYFQVPPEVMEDSEALTAWALEAASCSV